jgi:drug/metabolite transporter (DMT)-like permease
MSVKMFNSTAIKRALLSSAPASAYGILALSVMASSTAAITIRFAQQAGMPSLIIVVGRLVLATLFLTPVVWARHRGELRALERRDLLLALLAGFWLALHFYFFVSSLIYTTVLLAMLLGRSDPLWAPILEALWLKVYPGRLIIIGLVVTVIGAVVIALNGRSDAGLGQNPLLGGMFALIGALAFSLYIVIGRRVRPKVSTVPYVWLVYGCAAIVALVIVAFTGTSVTGYSLEGYGWIVVITLVPQLMGHSFMNYALRYFSATYVGLSGQLVTVGATVLALILFQEVPQPLQLVGSVAIVIGIVLATLGQAENQ